MSLLPRHELTLALGRSGLVGLPGPKRGSRVTAVVSSHHARYALLPWSRHLSGGPEWEAFARHRFTETHGAQAKDWEIRVSPAPGSSPRVACALDAELLSGLRTALDSVGAKLVSVQPALMHAFNSHRRRIGNGPAWLVAPEDGRLTIALIANGLWRLVRVRNVGEDWRELLPGLLSREAALARFDAPVERMVIA